MGALGASASPADPIVKYLDLPFFSSVDTLDPQLVLYKYVIYIDANKSSTILYFYYPLSAWLKSRDRFGQSA